VLGLENVKPDVQLRTGVFVVLALAVECALEGLVTEAEFRMWVFHVLAAGVSLWALISSNDWVLRVSGLSGIAAVVNDAILLSESEASFRYLVPSLVLLAAAGFVTYHSFHGEPRTVAHNSRPTTQSQLRSKTRSAASSTVQELAGQFGEVPGAIAAVANVPNLRSEIKQSAEDPAWVPFLLIGGAGLTFFSLTIAKWVTIDALFGLIKRSYDFDGVRTIYNELGVKYFSKVFYFDWGFILTYTAALIALVVATSGLSKKFEVNTYARVGALILTGFAFVSHTVVVLGLNDAAEELLVQPGAWLGSVGLLASGIGIWLSGRR
jgi:hypothetical protein